MANRFPWIFLKLIPIGLVGASTALAVLLAEGAIRLAVDSADFLHATTVEDEVLGLRIQPLTTGHDALGFRNRQVPERVDIVAIGDSMTYGVSAPRDLAWPQQLGGLIGERVYNMGLGGFGPLQYLHLAGTSARALKPRLLIVGFYFGNDMMDAYYVAQRPHWQSWRTSPVAQSGETAFDKAGLAEPRKRFEGLRNWLSRNSVLYSVLRETVLRRFATREREEQARSASPDVRLLWNDATYPGVRTIFTPQFRLAAVDLAIPAVREGLRIAQRAFAALKSEADSQGARLLLVLIPTKERAYCSRLRRSGVKLPESFTRLCEAETLAKAELQRFLEERHIAYIDATPALERQIASGVQLYPADSDGHPQGSGYGVIAREVAETVRRQFPKL